MQILFFISIVLIIFTMVGYPFILKLLKINLKKDKISFNKNFEPLVSIIIPVHNEEKVIQSKLENISSLNYPEKKIEIIITSDNSTDSTNKIVSDFMEINKSVKLVKVKKRMGKTNAQDEAVREARGEIIIFSDANSILHKNAVKEIVRYMYDDTVSYVAGKLEYINGFDSSSADSEETYWNYDLEMRQIESDLGSITAGNGALYGVRKTEYIEIDPIYSHDSVFPPKYVILGKKAKFNPDAIAYEKAGEKLIDEFKRKIRMSRKIIKINFIDMKKYNFFEVGIFSFFYFSHRLCRNFLFLFHLVLFFTNIFLLHNIFYSFIFIGQLFFYLLSILGIYFKNSKLKIFTYYSMTLLAQLIGALKELTGQSKPFWEIVDSTR